MSFLFACHGATATYKFGKNPLLNEQNTASLPDNHVDRLAWAAIRDWPQKADFDAIISGLDYGHLCRALLWDKVGRAMRSLEPELESLCTNTSPVSEADGSPSRQSLRQVVLRERLRIRRAMGNRKLLYCPFPFSRNARIIEALLEAPRSYEIAVPLQYAQAWPGAVAVASSPHRRSTLAIPAPKKLHAGILKGLGDIKLHEQDVETLGLELVQMVRRVKASDAELAGLKPHAVLVPVDNAPPFMETTLVARRRGISVIMLQHGLDCERFYLDDAYASHIATWGRYRRERYERDSVHQPSCLRDVGNTRYEHVDKAVGSIATSPGRWVWVTRPHRPEKCYAPSRRVDEGLRIFDALVEALRETPSAVLIIQCHTFDYPELYERRIAECGLGERVQVSREAIWPILASADVVISEDSTAGLDAMLLGKCLVHAHLSGAPPVMPFADMRAALPGFSHQDLVGAMRRASELSDADRVTMQRRQTEFLDFAVGPRDGKAANRFCEFVAEVLT
jgi:hypothetical protein